MTDPLRYVFYGTPDFALAVLGELERAGRLPVAVVCQPDRPKGRGRKRDVPPVKAWALERGLEVAQPAKQRDPEYLEWLADLAPDLALVAAFGQILTKRVLAVPRLGFINVHPSLVPRYRGSAPLQWTLINGDTQAGVSILKVVPEVDAGEVLAVERVEVDPDENAVELGARLGALGGRLALGVMERAGQGSLDGQPQDASQVVMARQLSKADGRLSWSQTARELHDRVRGVQPWPGAHTQLAGKAFKIHRSAVVEPDPGAAPDAAPGQVIEAAGDRLVIQTGQGGLRLLEVQLAGKKRMDARSFLAGRQLAVGDRLG